MLFLKKNGGRKEKRRNGEEGKRRNGEEGGGRNYFFQKDDLKSNHSASLSEEMDMTEREENIFGLDFSRGHSYKIAGRDTVSKKRGSKKTSSPFSEGGKREARGKTAGRNIVSKKGGSEKTSSPFSEREK